MPKARSTDIRTIDARSTKSFLTATGAANPVRIYTMYSGNNIILQEKYLGGTQTETRFNLILGDEILGHFKQVYPSTETLELFGLDDLGSRRILWDSSGNKKDTFTYSAWGEATHDYGSDAYLASFTGKEYDDSGLIYFNARYYDPVVGRFLSEDPSRKGHSWYSYCNNNPLTYTDPTGVLPVDYVAEKAERASMGDINAAGFMASYTAQQERLAQLQPRAWEAMAEWNKTHLYSSTTWVPGSTVTEPFMQKRYTLEVQSGFYVSYLHSGEDLSGPENVVESAGFYEVTNLSPHIVIARRIGTNTYARLSHLRDTSNLRIGQVLSPGEYVGNIAPTFPSKSQKGVLHIEEFMRERNMNTFANPSTHIPATGIDFYWIRERKIRDSAFETWYFEVLVNDPSVRPYRY